MAITTTLPILDLSILDLNDPTLLAIVDTSTYGTLPTSGQYNLQITPPGGWDTLSVPFTPGAVNIYKAVDLGIVCADSTCVSLPDGIYNVVYSVNIPVNSQASPEVTSIDKMFLKTDQIKCKYDNAFLKIDLECECQDYEQKKYKEDLKRIDLFINGAKVAANDCNEVLSFTLYDKANFLLDSICCKFRKPCNPPKSCTCH